MGIPIDLSVYKNIELDINDEKLSDENLEIIKTNIQVARDAIVFFTAIANAKGLGGHTGGAYDIMPEVVIINSLMNKKDNNILPILFDEAGHRVAMQYLMAVINGHMPEEKLLKYREFNEGLYGHPERNDANGILFSSGRLGHMWSHVNGVALANPDKRVIMFGSDGSQQEGDDSEAARFAVAQNLNVKLIIDDNDVTIAGHPKEYMKGYSVEKTLEGHSVPVDVEDGENIELLYKRIREAIVKEGPVAIINKRKMAIGIDKLEGLCKAHDVISADIAIEYLKEKGKDEAVKYLQEVKKLKSSYEYLGSSKETSKNRSDFGKVINEILDTLPNPKESVVVVDSDLEGSCGLNHIREAHPEVFIPGGIMERNNFSVAAGFGSTKGKQGIIGTFAAFQEMIISEITMARLNDANVICHFSHSGVDDMADNTCHFGINNLYADNGLGCDTTKLYFPADGKQLRKLLPKVFNDEGLRFVYSTRSATPNILTEDGKDFYGDSYVFEAGKDDIIRDAKKIFIVSYGEMLYRSLDAVERLRKENIDIGLINKTTLNMVDKDMMTKLADAEVILLVETQNEKTGVGSKFGTWLLESGYSGKYAHIGTNKIGEGGLSEQIVFQGLDPESIMKKIKEMI